MPVGAVPARLLPGLERHEKFYAGPAWLQYLIDHFWARDARASTSGDSQFTGLPFDHEMNGIIIGSRATIASFFSFASRQMR